MLILAFKTSHMGPILNFVQRESASMDDNSFLESMNAHILNGKNRLGAHQRNGSSLRTSRNIFWSEGQVTREQRWARNGHKGFVVWLTGLSGSGKSTLSRVIERELFASGLNAFVLDGDNLRHGLNSNLGFSPTDRSENIRRAAEAGSLLASAGHVAIIALISPYRQDRLAAREIARAGGLEFVEVYIDAPLEVCEQRDPKNLYKRARAGEIRDLTGIGAPYEPPENPEIHVRTDELNINACLESILGDLLPRLQLDSR
jgi:adenylyl-sulfate kinase